jgi:hypothetical protein
MRPPEAYQPDNLSGSLLVGISHLGVGFALEMLSELILPGRGYSAVPLA